jgi:hypothetical protein
MEATRLTPRVARHADAIARARGEGVTWRELATVFSTTADALRTAYGRARDGIERGRYIVQQLPLPEPQAAPVADAGKTPRPASDRSPAKPSMAGLPPVPGAKQENREPESDKDRLAKLGINFK